MITIEQFENGIMRYIENEIGAKATGVRKFGVYFLLPSIRKRMDDLIHQNHDLLSCYLDDNQNIDIDSVYNASKEAVRRSGQFEYMGLIFKENDIDSMYHYIQNY